MVGSRRTYNNRCRWWKVDKKNPIPQNLVIKEESSGIFFAKESENTDKNDQIDSGIVSIGTQITTIETFDDITGIDHKDLVEYLDTIWIVDDVRSKIINKSTGYRKKPVRKWWLVLRNRG